MIRTDLAAEFSMGKSHSGMVVQHLKIPFAVTDVRILTEDAAKEIGKPCGRYFTVEGLSFSSPLDDFAGTLHALSGLLQQLLPKNVGSALIIGLGNRDITPDSLGPRAVSQLLITRHLRDSMPDAAAYGLDRLTPTAALAPGVLGQTGIETAALVHAVVKEIRPELVIVIDALAAAEKQRLCTSLQLSDTGIAPGSGVKNHRNALNRETLGVPVIAIGVPTVIALDGMPGMFVTPREVDVCMEHAGKLIGQLCNLCLHPDVPLDELLALTGS